MLQAALPDGLFLDLLSRFQDLRAAAMVHVGRREVAEALVVASVVVVIDEGADLPLEVSRQEVVFQQDAVEICAEVGDPARMISISYAINCRTWVCGT